MSNTNNIIAFAQDTPYSATSFDGTTFSLGVGVPSLKWKTSSGTAGKFIYTQVDIKSRTVTVDYSITDSITWNAGVLLDAQLPCITAVAGSQIATSFNGSLFTVPGTVRTTTDVYYLYGIASVRTFSSWSRPVMQFRVSASAIVTSTKLLLTAVNPKMYYRTMQTAVVSSIGSFIGLWKW